MKVKMKAKTFVVAFSLMVMVAVVVSPTAVSAFEKPVIPSDIMEELERLDGWSEDEFLEVVESRFIRKTDALGNLLGYYMKPIVDFGISDICLHPSSSSESGFIRKTDVFINFLDYYMKPTADFGINAICRHPSSSSFCELISQSGPTSSYCRKYEYYTYTKCNSCGLLLSISHNTEYFPHDFLGNICCNCGWMK